MRKHQEVGLGLGLGTSTIFIIDTEQSFGVMGETEGEGKCNRPRYVSTFLLGKGLGCTGLNQN